MLSKKAVDEIVAIGSEKELVDIFGKPNGSNFETWFTAANFLQYGNALRVVRASSAILNATSGGSGLLIKSTDDYLNNYSAGQGSSGEWGARTAGTHGNSLGVSLCSNATAYEETFTTGAGEVSGTPAAGATTVNVSAGGGSVGDGGAKYNVGDIVHFQEADGQEYEVTAITNDALTIRQLDNPNGGGLKSALADGTDVRRRWAFYDLFDSATVHQHTQLVKVLSVTRCTLLYLIELVTFLVSEKTLVKEQTQFLKHSHLYRKEASAKTAQGGTNYYPDVIYGQSKFVYWLDHDASLSNAGTDPVAGTTFASTAGKGGIKDDNLSGGTDDYALTTGELALAYDHFADAETVDVNLIMGGTSPASADGTTHATKIIDIVEGRKDAVAFISPRREDVVNVSSAHTQGSNVKGFFDGLASSSYAVFDSGYKYMYDKFNDTFRYVPLNGDIAGLCANTDNVADPFFSPGGFNRGQIRGAVKLAFNPTKAQRDILYPARINPVATFPSQGTVLFGDKTAFAVNQVHLTESMFVGCLFFLRSLLQLLLSSSCLNSTMSSHKHSLETW